MQLRRRGRNFDGLGNGTNGQSGIDHKIGAGSELVVPRLIALESGGLKVIAEAAPGTDPGAGDRSMNLELVGLDRPGIVREIAQLLAASGVNVEELVTNRTSAPMSGDMLFEARAHVRVPAGIDLASLRAGLERLGNDLVVEVKLEERKA